MIKISLVGLYIGGEIVSLVRETGPVAQAVLVVLLVFSILSWSIILSKWASLRRMGRHNAEGVRSLPDAPPAAVAAPRRVCGIDPPPPRLSLKDVIHLRQLSLRHMQQ